MRIYSQRVRFGAYANCLIFVAAMSPFVDVEQLAHIERDRSPARYSAVFLSGIAGITGKAGNGQSSPFFCSAWRHISWTSVRQLSVGCFKISSRLRLARARSLGVMVLLMTASRSLRGLLAGLVGRGGSIIERASASSSCRLKSGSRSRFVRILCEHFLPQ